MYSKYAHIYFVSSFVNCSAWLLYQWFWNGIDLKKKIIDFCMKRFTFSGVMVVKTSKTTCLDYHYNVSVCGIYHHRHDSHHRHLFNVEFKCCHFSSSRCACADNAISRDINIFNGRSVLIDSVLHCIFLWSKSELLNGFYAVVQPLTCHVNCGVNWVRLFVNK